MNIEKIQKLIRLLSSSNDGEALAAVHALQRVLQEEGTDIHELAARIEGLSQVEMKKLYDAGKTEQEVLAADPLADLNVKWAAPQGITSGPSFLRNVYNSFRNHN